MRTEFTEAEIKRMMGDEDALQLTLNDPVRIIKIGTPQITIEKNYAIQRCTITLGDVEKIVTFSTNKEYADFLCYERGDAYLIGLLYLAMTERCDIYSEVPLTGELVHQLQTELIPTLTKYSSRLYSTRIFAELDDTPLPSAGKIGTGCSCGIDSLYTIKKLNESTDKNYKIDYLVHNNVGAFSGHGVTSYQRYNDNKKQAIEFCKKHGYKLITNDSNFGNAFPQSHLRTHLYSSVFSIYMLRKLWRRYYYASTGCDLEDYFGLKDNDLYDSAKYDLIALPAFSISQLRICNAGLYASRYEKTKELANDKAAQQFLSVCLTYGSKHCGTCSKCKRTLWMLDAIGKLNEFSNIFDIIYYKKNYGAYMRALYRAHLDHVIMTNESYTILEKKIGWCNKCRVIVSRILNNIYNLLIHPFKLLARSIK